MLKADDLLPLPYENSMNYGSRWWQLLILYSTAIYKNILQQTKIYKFDIYWFRALVFE
jgi:hypothetical protein